MTLYDLADTLSDSINVVFVILIAEEPLLSRLKAPDAPQKAIIGHALRFWARCLICVIVPTFLAELGKKYQIWPGHSAFPSGHTTFAVASAVCLRAQRGPRWRILLGLMTATMCWALVEGRWHTPDEVAGGLVLGLAGSLLLWRLTRGLAGRPVPSTSSGRPEDT